jgi:tetratricopeptide (TPR) repeat protein
LEVCQVSVDILDALCDAGLLESNGPSRYMLHQTISDYARDQLTDPAVAERLVSYYVTFIEMHAKEHGLLKLETSNILAALEIAHTSHQRAELIRSVSALAEFLLVRGLYSLAEKQLLRAYEAAQVLNDNPGIVSILRYLGSVSQNWGKLDQAEVFLLEGLEIARKKGYREQICDLLYTIGAVEDRRGNYAQAEACFREGLELARELDLQEQVCRLLNGLGIQAGKRGNFAQAEAYLQEGLAQARRSGYRERVVAFLHNLGTSALERSNYARAETYLQEAQQQAEEAGYEVLCGASQVRLGDVALKRGDFERSRNYLTAALKALRRIGDTHVWLQDALFSEGQLAVAEGDDEGAENQFRECLELSRRSGTREMTIELYTELAQIETRRSNYPQAQEYLQEIQPLAYELALDALIAKILYAWGELYLRSGSLASAMLNFAGARSITPPEQSELQALVLYGEARAASISHDPLTARQQGEASLAILTAIGHYRAIEVANWLKQIKR